MNLVTNCEQRYIWYKSQIEYVARNPDIFPTQDLFVQWYRAHLREMKNMEEGDLKLLIEEVQHERQGLNPPFCYPKTKK